MSAVAELRADELEAVLAHEEAHVRWRDPLRRVVSRAASDVLFFLPALRWWNTRHLERSEVAADRSAIRQVGRRAVASALLATAAATPTTPFGAAFEGAADARLAQLLDEPMPQRRMPARVVIASLAGSVVATSLLMCVGQAAMAL